MTTAVITGVSHHHEQELATALGAARGVEVVRRCADVAELLSTGASGVADVAVVSADFRGLDRDALRHLAGHGVRAAGYVTPGDDAGEARLRQLGITAILRPGSEPEELGAAIVALVEGDDGRSTSGGADGDATGPGAAGRSSGPAAGDDHAGTSITDADLERLLETSPGAAPDAGSGARARLAAVTGAVAGATAGSAAAGSAADGATDRGGESVDLEETDSSTDGLGGFGRGRVTAVWGPTGAPGRTTIAVAVAGQLAARGVRTLLVDLDTWGASVSQLLALIDEAPGVAAAARASEQGTLDRAALARVAPEVGPGLRVLTGIPKPDRWPELRAAAVEDVLDKARGLVDHVVVDCGFAIEDDEELSYDTAAPRRNATTLTALENADSLFVVGAADPIGLQRLVRAVQDVGVVPSPEPIVVVNKVRASATGPKPEKAITDVLGRFAGLEEPIFVPWAPDECDGALLAGRSLVEFAPNAAVTRAVGRLVDVVRPELVPAGGTRADRRSARGRGGRGPRRTT
ncbi:MinD-like ATPase involved in chromosome partitioning or flagellar assembly [Knoellia remsis]|uniref:MinD-like ATPase involved in chromosome partitioning or flagellar assembly n=1 Tax=Knoellia remsis TaxID=407159 RepID=A0A2T0UTK1_9MICO|nr:hypothetical protein [Knoellia remsis]PRY61261.1 MinD-like ATPase involved in chromosome partitioning or flagellar assembly [Knoellia remsis]